MAKKAKVNKTRTVLDYVRTHPGIGNKEVSAAMKKQGIKVSPGHVANIKGKAKAKHAERKAVGAKLLASVHAKQPAATEPAVAPEPATVEKPTQDTITLEHVKAVAKTVKDIGGFARLNELLGVIKEVGGMKKFKDLMEAMAVPETDKIPF